MAYRARATRVVLAKHMSIQVGERWYSCRALNVSLTGMALLCPVKIKPRTMLLLDFVLDRGFVPEHVTATVARVERTNEGFLHGVQFKAMTAKLLVRLRSYVADCETLDDA